MGFIILFALFSATVLLAYFVIVILYDDIVSVGVFAYVSFQPFCMQQKCSLPNFQTIYLRFKIAPFDLVV